MYLCDPKIQSRRILRHKPILFLITCPIKHLLIFLTACYLAYNWMTCIIILRLASLDSRLGFVYILFLFPCSTSTRTSEKYICARLQVKVSMADRHDIASTLLKLDASIVFGLCIFLDEPMLKQLEVIVFEG